MEFAAVFHRYGVPLMRTVVLGKSTMEARRITDAVVNTLNLVYENLKPGRTAHDIAVSASRGLEPIQDMHLFRSGVFGYSIGITLPNTAHDGPMYLMEGNDKVLEPGMAFHTVLSIRIPRELAVGLSDSVVMTERGYELLTDGKREVSFKAG